MTANGGEERPARLSEADARALLRWRLALGPEAERAFPQLGLAGLAGAGLDAVGLEGERTGELDEALSFVYGGDDGGGGAPGGGRGGKRGGRGGSSPYVPRWLGLLRDFFRDDVIALVQQDAIEKRGLTQLLFEPETLPYLERNVELVATLMSARGLVPDEAREAARAIIREVVEDLRRKLETELRTAVLGALRRSAHSPLPSARNLDWKRTIERNLRGWDRERRRLLAERFYFFASQRRRHEWDVAIAVDQSGSMAESVVYSSVMAAIFASIDALRTRLAVFDTNVVDLTPMLEDPVEVLFAAQLGGGTDIQRAVAYVQASFIERPERTIFLLVTDLYEGGDAAGLLARMRELVEAKVRVVVMLALSDRGRPSYDHELARRLAALGIPCFACSPRMLPRVMERLIKGHDLGPLLAEAADGKGKRG